MNNTFEHSIKRYEKFTNDFEKRVDDIVKNLTIKFKEVDPRLFLNSKNLSNTTSIEICIEGTSFARMLFSIDKGYKVSPIRALIGYPNIKELYLGDKYEDVQLSNQNDDIELISRMFDKYHSYGRLFKRVKKELDDA